MHYDNDNSFTKGQDSESLHNAPTGPGAGLFEHVFGITEN